MSQGNRRSRQKASTQRGSSPVIRAFIVLFGAVAVALLGFLVWSLATSGTNTGTPGVTPEATGGPKLKADHEVVDLGDIKLGNTTQAAFVLSNAGDQPLQIAEAPYIEVVEGC